ncbi:hypothetical protein [Kitasatospora purpeofusca]|uniref:hypothetical protein n=1 Tax=Kitasatospora purpeofusca TaxID=67352 RepID=UPI0035D71FFE
MSDLFADVALKYGGSAPLSAESVHLAAAEEPPPFGHSAATIHYVVVLRHGSVKLWPAVRLVKRAMEIEGITGQINSNEPETAMPILRKFGYQHVQRTRWRKNAKGIEEALVFSKADQAGTGF